MVARQFSAALRECIRELMRRVIRRRRSWGTRLVGHHAGHGRQRRPREHDPVVGALPHVVALHDRARLLVEDGGAQLLHLRPHRLRDEVERLPGVGDVVDDEQVRAAQVDDVEVRREDDRHVEALVDARVELDVDHAAVLHAERVRHDAGDEQPAAGDGQQEVGPVAVLDHRARELAAGGPEPVPTEDLTSYVVRHR